MKDSPGFNTSESNCPSSEVTVCGVLPLARPPSTAGCFFVGLRDWLPLLLRASPFEFIRNRLPDVAAGELPVAAKVQIPVRPVSLSPPARLTPLLAAFDHLQPQRANASWPLLYHLALVRSFLAPSF